MITHGADTKADTEAVDTTAVPLSTHDARSAFVSAGGLLRVPLSAATAAPPAVLWRKMFYGSGVHVWEGAPGSGKTMAALVVAADLIRNGKRVMYLDLENGPALVAERMASLGLTDAELNELFGYYPAPELDPQTFLQAVELADPALVIFDNMTSFLADAGINENDNSALTQWANAYTKPVKNRGSAALVLDHVTKRGNESRGGGAKIAEVDARFNVVQVKAFDRQKVGQLRFTRKKDRPGALPERVLTFDIGGSPFVFRPDVALTESEAKALAALEDGQTPTEWFKASGMPNSTFFKAKPKLVDAELVYVDGGRCYRTT